MKFKSYAQVQAVKQSNIARWKKLNPKLSYGGGIYILTRRDENGFRYAYIGQAVRILDRLASHLVGYQHIDLSLKKHGLYSQENPYGWQVDQVLCLESELDEKEREYIKKYADFGYQLRNKTIGGQDEGKNGIDDNKPSKGYHDGLKQGYQNCKKEVIEYFTKYLDFSIKGESGKIKERKFNEFKEWLKNE